MTQDLIKNSILNLSMDALVVLNDESRVIFWNVKASELFGYTINEVMGEDIAELIIPDEFVDKHNFGFNRYMQTKKSNILEKVIEINAKHKSGKQIPIQLKLSHVKDGALDFFVAFIRDYSEVLKKNDEILDQKKKLEEYIESNLQLENFAYYASHDLQTPLQNIINFSSLLDRFTRTKLNDKEEKYLDFIRSGAKQMQTLINELLNFSVIGNSELNKSNILLTELMDEVLEVVQLELNEQNVILNFSFEQDRVIMDKVLIKQVLINLISNSIKFRDENRKPFIELIGKVKENKHLFCVKDNGVGIPEDKLDAVLGIFKRLHNKSKIKGSGIGLALCKKIIEKHDGEIWIESELGQGTSVNFTIPFI